MSTVQQASRTIRRSKKRVIRAPALMACPFKKGIIVKLRIMKPKKPNSANRKIAKVRLSTGRQVIARIPGIGHFLQEHAVVYVHGKRIKDLPGMHYSIVKGVKDFSSAETSVRRQALSKYGYKNMKKAKRFWKKNTKRRKKKKNKQNKRKKN